MSISMLDQNNFTLLPWSNYMFCNQDIVHRLEIRNKFIVKINTFIAVFIPE